MTFNDLVKQFFIHATDEECNAILWNCTAFPFCDTKHTQDQLAAIFYRSGGDINLAISFAHEDLDKAMDEANKLEADSFKNINLTYYRDKFILWINGISIELNYWEMDRLQTICQTSYLLKYKEDEIVK